MSETVEQLPRAVVLVEGASDAAALETLAARREIGLAAAGVSVIAMGGSKNITRFLDRYGPPGLDRRLAGLCDAGEERDFLRGLERAGLGSGLTRADMHALGFFVCVEDLEDELIRALGPAKVERIIEAQGELGSLRIFRLPPLPMKRRSCSSTGRPRHAGCFWRVRNGPSSPCAATTSSTSAAPSARISSSSRSSTQT